MNNKKILITGGYGFIGSNFINHMIDTYDAFEITNVDFLGAGSNINNINKPKNDNQKITNVIHDIFAYPYKLDNEKYDYVIHFAAESHVDRSITTPTPFIESNIVGTFNILEYVKNSGSGRMIMISTDEVYGSMGETEKATEDFPINPSSVYSASKAAAENLCNAYVKTYGLDIITTRCSNNYGPNQFEEKLIPKVVYHIMEGLPIPVYDEGQQVREWTYVLDHVKDIIILLEYGITGEVYNIGHGVAMKNIDLVNLIKSITLTTMEADTGKAEDNSPIEFLPNARPAHDYRYAISLQKINELKRNNNIIIDDYTETLFFPSSDMNNLCLNLAHTIIGIIYRYNDQLKS